MFRCSSHPVRNACFCAFRTDSGLCGFNLAWLSAHSLFFSPFYTFSRQVNIVWVFINTCRLPNVGFDTSGCLRGTWHTHNLSEASDSQSRMNVHFQFTALFAWIDGGWWCAFSTLPALRLGALPLPTAASFTPTLRRVTNPVLLLRVPEQEKTPCFV